MESQSIASSLLHWSILQDPRVLRRCSDSLRDDGVAVLRNVATAEGLKRLREEIFSVSYNDSKQYYTPWQDQGDLVKYPEDHPRNFKMHSSAAFVGRKTLEESTKDRLCLSVYNFEDRTEANIENVEKNKMLQFVSSVAGRQLYQSEDENGSVYSYRIHSHHNPMWHFDESPYTAILYLQNPEVGGDFEFIPWCRPTTSKDDPQGHEVVRRLLMRDGQIGVADDDQITTISIEPGTLVFFNGSKSFHRAGSITGTTPRVGLVFTFGESQGFSNSESVKNANEWDPEDSTCLKNDTVHDDQ